MASASLLVYVLLLMTLYQHIGLAVLPLMLLPVLTATRVYGIPGTLTIIPLIIIIHVALYYQLQPFASLIDPVSIITHVAIIFLALIIGESSHLQTTFLDTLNHRKVKTKTIRQQRKVYETLFESAGDAVFTLSFGKGSAPVFNECNDATLSFFKCQDKSEIIGKSPLDFSPAVQPNGKRSIDEIKAIAHKVMLGQPQVFEWLHELPDGRLQWGEVNLCLIDFAGEYFLQAIVRNIDDRKQAETELREHEVRERQSHKMEAIGILTGGIAHEFNNLLVPILGYTELLLRKETNPDDRKMIQNISKAANRAKKLVQQMLAYGRHSMSQFEDLQLNPLVEQTISFLVKSLPENILVKHNLQRVPVIRGMANELQQVMTNVSLNALHAMPNGGELTISLKNVGDKTFNHFGKPLIGEFIELTIADTGTGMSEDVIEQMFDPFFTTKDIGNGSGLGLSVVQGIVEQHNGHIVVESTIDEGTRFHIYLPVTAEI